MRYFIFPVLVLCILSACKNRQSSDTPQQPDQITQMVANAQPPADFLSFYEKFHLDSLYQIAHIVWPLSGETSEPIDSIHHRKKLVEWQPQTWRMHHPVDFKSGDYKHEYEMLGDVLVIEHIHYAAAKYGLERRFAKNEKDEWELIFYGDMQER